MGIIKDVKEKKIKNVAVAPAARDTIAYLVFSSGTTGRPKAVAIPHYAVMANVIQMAHYGRTTDAHTDRYKPGQVALAGM